jgi:hypothetical protein
MERWQQVESLFQEALQRGPAERDAWLRECPWRIDKIMPRLESGTTLDSAAAT